MLFFNSICFSQESTLSPSIFIGSGTHCGGIVGIGYEQNLGDNFAFLGAIGTTADQMTYDISLRYYPTVNSRITLGYGPVKLETGGNLGFDYNIFYGIEITSGYRYIFESNIYIGSDIGLGYAMNLDEAINDLTKETNVAFLFGLVFGYMFN